MFAISGGCMQSVLSLAVSGVQCQMSCIYRTLSTTRPTDPVRFKHLSPPPDIRPAYNGLLLRALVRANLCIAPQVPLTSFRPSQQNTPFSLGVAASPRALLADVPDDTCSNKPLYDGIHNIASTLPRLLPCQRSLSLVRSLTGNCTRSGDGSLPRYTRRLLDLGERFGRRLFWPSVYSARPPMSQKIGNTTGEETVAFTANPVIGPGAGWTRVDARRWGAVRILASASTSACHGAPATAWLWSRPEIVDASVFRP
ncbi:hypothetical protein C8Q72DRAFT_221791 [Fomitopsis betulina]|nr:hypothetical protein C8Q72DRAFT_221791 [Fomitopsis betulina]